MGSGSKVSLPMGKCPHTWEATLHLAPRAAAPKPHICLAHPRQHLAQAPHSPVQSFQRAKLGQPSNCMLVYILACFFMNSHSQLFLAQNLPNGGPQGGACAS